MSYSAMTQPGDYSAAYSAIPLRINSTDTTILDDYKYVINIAYSAVTSTGSSSVSIGTATYTKLDFDEPHGFEIGDTLLLDDSSNQDIYSDYYNILSVPSNLSVVADFALGAAMTANTEAYKVITYKMSPDLEGEAKLDLSNSLKDFVTENLTDTNEIFAAPNTKFEYELLLGQESKYVFEFTDNIFSTSGTTGFVNSALTASDIAALPFKVGDQISILQDEFQWNYDDNYWDGGELGFSSATNPHNFLVGQTINVTGQITNQFYNGLTKVRTVDDEYHLTTWKTFGASSPAEPGSIFGTPRPTYNTVASVTGIYFSAGTGVVINTDVAWAGSSQIIPGEITYADDVKTVTFNNLTVTGLTAYNARINTQDYGYGNDQFDKYIIKQSRAYSGNNISSILSGATKYRIESDSKSWLLAHADTSGYGGDVYYTWYDVNGTVLSNSILDNVSNNDLDYYFPVGIDQLEASSNRTDVGASLASVKASIDYYKVEVIASTGTTTAATNSIYFEVNNDCSAYEVFKLMWKDRYGSWVSFPFNYISKDMTEVERKDYYKTEGTWDLTNNTFGFDTYDRGQKSYFVRSRDKYVLNSGLLVEAENVLMKDLMESASVYLQKPDGNLVAAMITNKSIDLKKKQSDYVWNYSFEVSTSTNEIRL